MSDEESLNEEVLTEEESEALLEQSEPSRNSGSGISDPGHEFWDQVVPNRIPEFDAINGELAQALGQIWMKMFRRQIVVSAMPALRMTGRARGRSIDFEGGVRSFSIQGRAEQCLLIVQPDTISAMVDLCFGGTGGGGRSERLAGLTGMENRQFSRFCDELREQITQSWRARTKIAFQDSPDAFSVSAHPLCSSSDPVFVSKLQFDVAEREHSVELVWPATLIDMLRESRPAALPAANSEKSLWTTRLSEEVRDAEVQVRAVIGGIPLRLHQISTAKAGEIIMTDPLTRVCLLAGDQPVFEGTLGTHNGLNAVKITRPFSLRRSGDE